MPELKGFPHKSMQGENDCWLACAAMLYSYITGGDISIEQVREILDVKDDEPGSAIDALYILFEQEKKRLRTGIDRYAIPTPTEIKNQLKKKIPLVCCVGEKKPVYTGRKIARKDPARNLGQASYADGHWIIITGFNGKILTISDPSFDSPIECEYHGEYYTYYTDVYWANTSYLSY